MASIHRDPRKKSPFWYVSYRTLDGKQHFKSTKEVLEKRARIIADGIEEGLSKGKKNTFTEVAARSLIADLHWELNGKDLPFISIEKHFHNGLERIRKNREATTHSRYKGVIEAFLEFLGPLRAKAPLDSLVADEIQGFADNRSQQGLSAKTVSNDLKPIGKFLKDAERRGVILKSPMGGVELPEATSEERNPFSEKELSALFAYLRAENVGNTALDRQERISRRDWLTVTMLGRYAGLRLGDCLNLRWGEVDLDAGIVRFIPEKSRKPRQHVVPIHSALKAHLLLIGPSDKTQYLAPSLGGSLAGHRASMSREFGAILECAGIDRRPGEKKTGKGRTFYRLGFHSLRHTFNSSMANAGVSIEMRAKLSGHSTLAMNETYTHHEIEVLRQAVGTIPVPLAG